VRFDEGGSAILSGLPDCAPFSAELEKKKYKLHVRVKLSRYRGYAMPGVRRSAAAAGSAAGANRREVYRRRGADEHRLRRYCFFETLELEPEEAAIAEKVLVEIRQRLKFLNDVGLEYLTLDRLSATLSGARRSAFSSPPASGHDWWGPATCWTSVDRAAYARHRAADPHSRRAARSGQYDLVVSTIRT